MHTHDHLSQHKNCTQQIINFNLKCEQQNQIFVSFMLAVDQWFTLLIDLLLLNKYFFSVFFC